MRKDQEESSRARQQELRQVDSSRSDEIEKLKQTIAAEKAYCFHVRIDTSGNPNSFLVRRWPLHNSWTKKRSLHLRKRTMLRLRPQT